MRNDRCSSSIRVTLRSTPLALALFLAGQQSALAVAWTTGSSGGNWIYLDPTGAEVGIGTSASTNPQEKLTITGGNVLVDNNRYYRGKNLGGSGINLIGLNNADVLTLYNGKMTIDLFGGVTIPGAATINGPINLNGPVSSNVLFNGNVGVGFSSTVSKFYVLGKSTFNGQINVTGGQLLAEGGFQSLGDFWSKNATVNDSVRVGGRLRVQGPAIFNNTASFNSFVDIRDLNVVGNLMVFGAKNFVQPHPTDDTRKIVYVAAEAGEALTMARGVSRTENGQATVLLPDHFALVTSEDAPLTVQLTVEGAPALIYVVSKSRQAIEVKMKESDYREFQDVAFNYFVQGVRDGFEEHIAIQAIHPSGEDARPSPKRARYDERVRKAFPDVLNRSR